MTRRPIKWKRRRDTDGTTVWTSTINGTHVVIANRKGQSVRYTGLGEHVFVWRSTTVEPTPWNGTWTEVHRDYTVHDAKRWAEDRYSHDRRTHQS